VLSVLCESHGGGYGQKRFRYSEAQINRRRYLASLIGAMLVSMRISAVRRCGMRSSAVEELPPPLIAPMRKVQPTRDPHINTEVTHETPQTLSPTRSTTIVTYLISLTMPRVCPTHLSTSGCGLWRVKASTPGYSAGSLHAASFYLYKYTTVHNSDVHEHNQSPWVCEMKQPILMEVCQLVAQALTFALKLSSHLQACYFSNAITVSPNDHYKTCSKLPRI
jgi:hypothetical protein